MSGIELYASLAAALTDIHRLKKSEKNDHGGYKYVSVDDVKDHVRPILAKHDLFITVTEQAFELLQVASKNGSVSSAKITFAITIHHKSGQSTDPDIITICLPYTGAQTAGAARSYAVKEWMKGTLLVSTGEKDHIEGGADADVYRQQEYITLSAAQPPAADKSSARAHKEDGEAFKRIQKGLHDIERDGTLEDLSLFWKNNQPALKTMKKDWLKTLTTQKDELKAKFEKGLTKSLDAPSTDDQYAEGVDPETGEVLDPNDFTADQ